MDHTKSQLEFIDQRARELMVAWAHTSIHDPDRSLPLVNPNGEYAVYFNHAIAKGWVSKDGVRVLAAGFETASRFLKR